MFNLIKLISEAYRCLISRDVQFNKAAMINKSNHASSKTDININKTNNAETSDQSTKIKVLLSSIHEEDMQPQAVEDVSHAADSVS